MPIGSEPRLLVEGLKYAESPRWRVGRLFLADQHAREVLAVDLDGRCERVAQVPSGPSGLGWLPDGTLLVVSMHDRKLLAMRGGRLVQHADLSGIATGHCNDMVVDEHGRAYVGNFGFDMDAGAPLVPAKLALVLPDGSARTVADDLLFPNGMVILPGGDTLIVAETYGARLSAFDIAADGSLCNRRIWATLSAPPDGICLDAEGRIWVAHPVPPGGFARVTEGGEVLERITTGAFCGIACMLGGPNRRSLFLVEAQTFDPQKTWHGNARVRVVDVVAPGAGHPAWIP